MSAGRSRASIAIFGYLARRLGATPFLTGAQRTRRDQLDQLTRVPGSIVFLGDRITERGEWQELRPDLPVVNRGVGGETSAQFR